MADGEVVWEPFFRLGEGGEFHPAAHGRSPWSEEMMHGRLLAGLGARAVELGLPPGFRCVRLTVDMFRYPPMAPVSVSASAVRDGRRVKLDQVDLAIGGTPVARVTALSCREGSQPPGVVWQAEAWSMPAPESLPVPALGPRPFPSEFRYPEGAGPWGLVGQKRVWVRDTAALVAGEEPSPLVLAAIAADFASPLSHGGEGGLAFINGDVTLYLARYPVDDWIGFEVSGHVSAEGIAVGYCTLHDRQGTIGYSMASAVANQPMSAG